MASERNQLMAKTPTAKLRLKDYLRDDLSSCSSNGFRSFPRRQCCGSSVGRIFMEIDLKPKDSPGTRRFLPRTASRRLALTTISALQRASDAVIRVIKQLPYPAAETKSPAKNRGRKRFLRKLLMRSFRKKVDTRRCRSFQELLNESENPSDHAGPGAGVTMAGRNSTSSSSNCTSWTESEFTSEMTSGDSEGSSENDAVKGEKLVSEREGASVGEDSTATIPDQIAKQWASEEEKEQFSPVSVLDFPFHDEEDPDHVSSSFREKKQKLQTLQKTKRQAEEESPLEPLDLQKRFAESDLQIHKALPATAQQQQQTAYELLKLLKSQTTSSQCLITKTENLLLDFFHEKLEETIQSRWCEEEDDNDLAVRVLKMSEDWMNEMVMEWDGMVMGRSLYVEEMEKGGKWRGFEEEKRELASGFEAEIWVSLLHELLIDFSCS